MSQLDRNTATLNELLELAQNLPEAGTTLPELSNPGAANDLANGTQLIDADGNVVEGKLVVDMISTSASAPGNLIPTTKIAHPSLTNGEYILQLAPQMGFTAEQSHVLSGKSYLGSKGYTIGSMANKGAVSKTLNASSTSYTIPAGYHNGSGKVSITTETKTATPTKSTQNITPTSGKVLSKVTVNPIPDRYADVSAVTAEAKYVAKGYSFVDANGNAVAGKFDPTRIDFVNSYGDSRVITGASISDMSGTPRLFVVAEDLGTAEMPQVLKGYTFTSDYSMGTEGTMPNNGAVQQSIDVMTGVETAQIAKGYHNGSGVVRIADTLNTALSNVSGAEPDLEIRNNVDTLNINVTTQTNLISQIQTALEGKAAGGGGSVETCTLTIKTIESNNINATARRGAMAALCCYIDGQYVAYQSEDNSNGEYFVANVGNVIPNVVKNSIVDCGFRTSENTWLCSAGFETENIGRYRVTGDGIIAQVICFVLGTSIMLYDRSTKPVQDITYNDELLVWDFDNGCYASAKPIWIKKIQTTASYYRCEFEDGTVLKLVGSDGNCHRVFSVDDGAFVYATECVGKRIMTMDGITKQLSCELIEEEVEFYNVITNHHLNLYAEGVLTSCRLNNLYPIKDMKFVKDDRQIRPYEAYYDVGIDFYKGLRLGEQQGDISMLNAYLTRLRILQKAAT